MQKSTLIPIQSIQEFLRFKLITIEQYRILANSLLENDTEFLYNINSLIEENLIDPYDHKKLTIFDRFIILLLLKHKSCNSFVKLQKTCDKCKKEIPYQININQILTTLNQDFKKNYSQIIEHNNFLAYCSFPSIFTEYQIYKDADKYEQNKSSSDFILDYHLCSLVIELFIDDKPINFINLSFSDKKKIIDKLPYPFSMKLMQYKKEIDDIFEKTQIVKINCRNKKCKHETNWNLSSSNMTDFIKLIYSDFSNENLLGDLYNLSCESNINWEKETIKDIEFIKEQLKKKEELEKQNTPKTRDLLEEYRSETQGMKESASEFS